MWATWCPPCRYTIPLLTNLAKKHQGKLEVIGITNETDEDHLLSFVERMGDQMDYNVAFDKEGHFIRDYAMKFSVNTIPHAFLVDKKGEIVWHNNPQDPSLEDAINKAISD